MKAKLDQIDTLTAQIATLTSRIEQLLAAMRDTRSRGDGGTGGDPDRPSTGHGVEPRPRPASPTPRC